jgi:phage tail sheath gpL-like
MEGSDTVTAGLVEVEVVFEEVEELVAPVVDGVAEVAEIVVELEGVFEVEAGVACSGGTKKIMKKAPTTSAIMSNATKDAVLNPKVARFLIKLVSKTFFYFCAFFSKRSLNHLREMVRSSVTGEWLPCTHCNSTSAPARFNSVRRSSLCL